MEISRFAARARRGVNVQNEIRFDVYDNFVSQFAAIEPSPLGQRCQPRWNTLQQPSPLGKVDCREAARRKRSFEDEFRAFIAKEARGGA